jgi:hypothetical protein
LNLVLDSGIIGECVTPSEDTPRLGCISEGEYTLTLVTLVEGARRKPLPDHPARSTECRDVVDDRTTDEALRRLRPEGDEQRCLKTTPFCIPVEPDVYWSIAGTGLADVHDECGSSGGRVA